jgi:hypothetical protein
VYRHVADKVCVLNTRWKQILVSVIPYVDRVCLYKSRSSER